MARTAKTLLERVWANSFRADRYGRLLVGPPLPEQAPRGLDARIWRELCELQREYQREPPLSSREIVASSFSKAVRALHGGRRPWWLLKPPPLPASPPFEFDWTPVPMPAPRPF